MITGVEQLVGIKQVLVNTPDELTVLNSSSVKLTFLSYPYPKVFDLVTADGNLKLFTTLGLAAQKAYTIGRKGEYRDYFDLYSILQQTEIDLEKIIQTAVTVYGNLFNPKLFLEQLSYFEDLLDFGILPVSDGQVLPSPQEVRDFLIKQVWQYLSDHY